MIPSDPQHPGGDGDPFAVSHPAPPLIEARALCRRTPAGLPFLEVGQLALYPGDRVAIEGPSGAGKSLLLRALALLDPLDDGQLLWCGQPIRGEDTPRHRARVSYLPQRAHHPAPTVEASLQLPYQWGAHQDQSFNRALAMEWLGAWGRDPEFLKAKPTHLSGGEAQMVSLIRTLLLAPTLLLLDECTAAMDPLATQTAEVLLENWLAADSGRALVWVSHDPAQRHRMTRRARTMRSGQLQPVEGGQ